MRKRHLNNDSIAHNSLFHLQKGSDGTSIRIIPLRLTDEGLKCNGKGYIRKGTPLEKRVSILHRERERERERELKFTVKESALTINDQPLLEPARGRIYIEFVSLSFILTALVLLSSTL